MQACTVAPIGRQDCRIDVVVLSGTGRDREPPRGPDRRVAPFGHRRFDLDPAAAELPQHLVRTPATSPHPCDRVSHSRPSDRLRRVAELGLVQEPGRAGVRVQVPAVQRPPHAVLAPGRVRDHDMRVELRVTGPARPMPKRRPDQPAARRPARHRCDRAATATPPAPRSRPPHRPHASCAAMTAAAVSGSPSAQSTDTDFGADNVRSNAHTRPFPRRRRTPVDGSAPDNTARKSSSSTSPARPNSRRPLPIQRPGTSPCSL